MEIRRERDLKMDESVIFEGFEKVWKMFQETERQFKEAEVKRQQEMREAEVKRQQEMRMAEEKWKKELREIREAQDKRDEKMYKEMREADERLRTELGKLGNRLGEFVEYMVKPAVVRLFQERGIEVHEIHHDLSAKRPEGEAQVDLLVINDDVGVVVEAKSKLSQDDVEEHIERMNKFKLLFRDRDYNKVDLMGAVAGMVIPDNVARYAYRKGFFVLAQSGENVTLLNDGKFQPKLW